MGGGERGRRQGRHGRAGRLPSALGPGFADRGSCKQPLWCLIQCLHFRFLGCFPAGDYKQHNHTQHDFHQNVAEVWAVGRQQSQHGIWLGVFVGAAADKGNGGPSTEWHVPCWRSLSSAVAGGGMERCAWGAEFLSAFTVALSAGLPTWTSF